MPGFLYYIPGRTEGITADEVAACGLGYALGREIRKVSVVRGPDGGQGVLVVNAGDVAAELTAYRAAEQIWRKAPGSDNWVGVHRDPALVPLPETLARHKQLAGHLVVLLDARPWLVPVARGWTEEDGDLRWYHGLPRQSELSDDGRWQPGPVLAVYAPLWALAQRWFEARTAAAVAAIDAPTSGETLRVAFDFAGLHDAAVTVLQANYRVGPTEAALLGLLSAGISREILDALVDEPTLSAWLEEKKTAPPAAAGGNTAAGSAGSTGTTGRP